MDFGGITELTNFLKLLANDESYDNVETIVVARDAETDAKAAIDSIQNSMRQAKIPVPEKPFEYTQDSSLKTAFMIFPGPEYSSGRLEDLCLLTVESDPLLECVDDYLECAKTKGEQLTHIHKNKLHAFLAGKKDYAGLPIGLASHQRAWDIEHHSLDPFKKIIQEM
jgi:DNA-binding protein Fis